MARSSLKLILFILKINLYFINVATVNAAVCNTNQNPYCAGNDAFEQICCDYPDVCYWSDRDGNPACCPYGQICMGGNAPSPNPEPQPQPNPTSVIVVTSTTIQTRSTITKPSTSITTNPSSATPIVYSTITTTRTHSVATSTEPTAQSTITITSSSSEPGFIEGATSTVAGAVDTAVNVIFGNQATTYNMPTGAIYMIPISMVISFLILNM